MSTMTVIGHDVTEGAGSSFGSLPKSTVGRIAATLCIVSLVAVAVFVPTLDAVQNTMGGTPRLGWVVQMAAVLMILTGGAASILGMFAITRHREHSWAVLLALAPAASFVVIMIVEMFTVAAGLE